jgi:hypothetical protein
MTISTPKPETGIKQSLFHPYKFDDQAWADPAHPDHPKFTYLSAHCILVGDDHRVRDKCTGRWVKVSRKGLIAKLLSERGGLVNLKSVNTAITRDDINHYLSSGVPSFSAITFAPGAPEFLIFDNEKRLNIYRDERRAGDTDHIIATEEFLKIIRNSLCAEPEEIGLEAMIAEIGSSEHTLFKWVLHWLAARYQRPGYAPQTNLWFIGPLRGVGKGTLVSLMKGVLGGHTVGKANQLDIAKGWTNSLFGHELVEWDEFKAGSWHETANIIKRARETRPFRSTLATRVGPRTRL